MKRGNEQQEDEQREGDEEGDGWGVGMGSLNFQGILGNQLDGAKETKFVSEGC